MTSCGDSGGLTPTDGMLLAGSQAVYLYATLLLAPNEISCIVCKVGNHTVLHQSNPWSP
jgi:hypothetical protein